MECQFKIGDQVVFTTTTPNLKAHYSSDTLTITNVYYDGWRREYRADVLYPEGFLQIVRVSDLDFKHKEIPYDPDQLEEDGDL